MFFNSVVSVRWSFLVLSSCLVLTLKNLVDKMLHLVNGHSVLLSHAGFSQPPSFSHQDSGVPVLVLYPAQYTPQIRGHRLPAVHLLTEAQVVGPERQSKKVCSVLHLELLLRGKCGHEGSMLSL